MLGYDSTLTSEFHQYYTICEANEQARSTAPGTEGQGKPKEGLREGSEGPGPWLDFLTPALTPAWRVVVGGRGLRWVRVPTGPGYAKGPSLRGFVHLSL